MLGHACCHQEEMHYQNRLQLQEHICPSIPWSLELLEIHNIQSQEVFFTMMTLNDVSKVHVASGSTNSLLTKNNLWSLLCDMSSLVPTSLVRRSWSLKMPASNSHRKNASCPLASSTLLLLPWTSPEWTFLRTHTFILQVVQVYKTVWYRTINKTNAVGCICISYGWDHLEGHHDSTPWIWLRIYVGVQTYTYTIYLPTYCEFPIWV